MPKVYTKQVKQEACNLRSQGWSLGEISQKMAIPKNTISGWVKNITLSATQTKRIKAKEALSAAIGRPLAVRSLRAKKEKWKQKIRDKVQYLDKLPFKDPEIGRLVCGLLYLCEGAKYPASRYLYFGNSDYKLISFFLTLLRNIYKIDEDKLRFGINYRWDQDYEQLKNYWSNVTGIPKTKCLRAKPDLRTKGKPL
ncbi:hypothetical protein ACFL2I_01130 [Candidatus Omnitrophota bacterium]